VKRGLIASLLLSFSLALLGCGPGGPSTVAVTGKVTKAGAGLANVNVSLVDPLKPDNTAAGTTDASGAFTLTYGTIGKSGAVPGKYKVVLTGGTTAPASAPPGQPTGSYGGGQNAAPKLDTPFDAKWSSHETSPMEVEVKSGMAPLDIKVD
jgi:hypothetical protein